MSLSYEEERAFSTLIRDLRDVERAGRRKARVCDARGDVIVSLLVVATALCWIGAACWWPLIIGGGVLAGAAVVATTRHIRALRTRRLVQRRRHRP